MSTVPKFIQIQRCVLRQEITGYTWAEAKRMLEDKEYGLSVRADLERLIQARATASVNEPVLVQVLADPMHPDDTSRHAVRFMSPDKSELFFYMVLDYGPLAYGIQKPRDHHWMPWAINRRTPLDDEAGELRMARLAKA